VLVSGANAVALLGCGGSFDAMESGLDASRSDGASRVDTGAGEAACVADPSCAVEGAPDSSASESGAQNQEFEADVGPETGPVPGVLCGYFTGPIEAQVDGGEPAIACMAGWLCVPLGAHWACCTVEGAGGASVCDQPFVDGGG
jgi:hypothetical protein